MATPPTLSEEFLNALVEQTLKVIEEAGFGKQLSS